MNRILNDEEFNAICKAIKGSINVKEERQTKECATLIRYILKDGTAKGKTSTAQPLLDQGYIKKITNGWTLSSLGSAWIETILKPQPQPRWVLKSER